ncbi:MAG: GTPase ObgE [bacterium]
MFIDDVTIHVEAGAGGKGTVSFDKNKGALGATGGSGGCGGSVFIEGVSDLSVLRHFRNKKDWRGEDGKDGRGQWRDGRDGDSIVLKVPVGTVVHNNDADTHIEIKKINERICVARGGRGGRGNFHFRSSINTSPKEFEEGKPGGSFEIRLELKLIADIGFIGLPNVGKSSLLNELTGANVKVANYRFTTLEPNLGAFYDLIFADIPGLIEGASEGKGLGIRFLRHIERTKILFHFISADSLHPVEDYLVIRKELGGYNKELLKKQEYVFISKSDEVDEKTLQTKKDALKKITEGDVIAVSILDDTSMNNIRALLNTIASQKHV